MRETSSGGLDDDPGSRAGTRSSSGTGGTTGASMSSAGGTIAVVGEATIAGKAGQASSGAGAANANPRCVDIVPRCKPGELICDPVLGKQTQCSECGQALPGAVDECVRLIASDKESDGLCTVRGKDKFQCLTSFLPPEPTLIPADVSQVLLPDDFPDAGRSAHAPCFRFASGAATCWAGAASCSRLVLGDNGACAICNEKLFCDAPLAGQFEPATSLIDVAITDNEVFVLDKIRGLQSLTLSAPLPSQWLGTPARLRVDHRLSGCIESDLGEIACWLEATRELRPSPWRGPYVKLVPTTMPQVCVLDDQRQLSCGNVFDAPPLPLGPSDSVDIVASLDLVCSLSVSGHVRCWRGVDGVSPAIRPLDLPEGW